MADPAPPVNPEITPQAVPSVQVPAAPAEHHISTAVIILLLLIFPPLAWYFMYRDKKYHSWFPSLLVIFGVIFEFTIATQILTVIPKLSTLYSELNAPLPKSIFLIYLLAVVNLIGIIYGVYAFTQFKRTGEITKTVLRISLILLVTIVIGSMFSILISIVQPLYNLTAQF